MLGKNKSRKPSWVAARICFVLALIALLAGPLHVHHDVHHEDEPDHCVLCHAGDHAVVVAAASDAGKPVATFTRSPLAIPQPRSVNAPALSEQPPRAPPTQTLSQAFWESGIAVT